MYALALVAAVVLIVLIWLFYHKQRSGEIYVAVIHYGGMRPGTDHPRFQENEVFHQVQDHAGQFHRDGGGGVLQAGQYVLLRSRFGGWST